MKINREFASAVLFSALAAWLISSTPLISQVINPGVQQQGAVTAGHCVKWGPGLGQISDNGGTCAAAAPVSSVFGRTGAVTAQSGDYTIAQITNGLSNALANTHIFVGDAGGLAADVGMSGDCTIANTGAITCTKTGGVSFAASATTDTTNATNIASGTLAYSRLSLTNTHILVGNAGNNPADVALSQDCTIANTGVITCTKTNNVAFAASATTDTTNATNIASGTLNTARLPSPFTSGSIKGNTSIFATSTAAAVTTGHVASWDANGNLIDGGAAGSGTVTSVVCNGLTITSSGTCPESFDFANCTLSASAASSALTVALKDAAGNDPSASSPCRINFGNVTLTTGLTSAVSVTAATSVTLASGNTMGVTSSTAFRIWVVAFNNAGTVELGAINASNASQCFAINEGSLQSSSASSGNLAAGVYATTTARSSLSIKIIGYLEWNTSGVTAGTWTTTNLAKIRTFGPGIAKPCSRVQTVYFSTTDATHITATSYTATAATQNITLTSPVNLVRAASTFAWVCSNGSANQFCNVGLERNATRIGVEYQYYPTPGSDNPIEGGSTLEVIDKPNSSSAVTYAVYGKISAATGFFAFNLVSGSAASAALILDEIQG